MERNDRPAEPEEKKRLIEAGFVADNIQLGTTWSRGAVGASMTTEEALLLVDAEDKQRRMDRLVALCAGGARTVEHAEALLRQIEGAREPYSRCPKCGAVPLADTDDALFCEPCNRWYSRRPLPGAPDSDHEQPIADRAPSDGSGVDWTLMDDEEVLINAAVVCDAKALADGTAFPAKWGVVAARLRKMSDGLSTSSTKSAAPNWSDLTDREAQWIAREAGCDVRAVQLALQGRDGVRDDIRARVLEVAPRIRQAAPAASAVNFREEAMHVVAARLAGREGADIGVVRECCEKAPFDDIARETARVQRALEAAYQRGLSERPVPPAAIPLNAAQLRALAESDETGDAPLVATASALREVVAARKALGVLAVIKASVVEAQVDEDAPVRAFLDMPEIPLGVAQAGERVTVAVLDGNVAAVVEVHRTRERFAAHARAAAADKTKCTCSFWSNSGEPAPDRTCEEGVALAAAVRAALAGTAQAAAPKSPTHDYTDGEIAQAARDTDAEMGSLYSKSFTPADLLSHATEFQQHSDAAGRWVLLGYKMVEEKWAQTFLARIKANRAAKVPA